MKWLNGYRSSIMLVSFVAAIILCSSHVKADFTWVQKADMPTLRWMHTSVAVNGKIYVIGGAPSEPASTVFSTVEEYNPITNTWTMKADMPTPRGWLPPSIPIVDGKIYVIGGSGYGADWYSPTVEEYDPGTDTWTRKANMPTGRYSLATCVVGGKIYAFGGLTSDVLQGSNVVEEYDSTTDTWTGKSDMPTGLWALGANVVNDKIYVFGGRPGLTAIPNVQEYDPVADTWTRKADMPIGTSQMASVVLDNKIIVIGGWEISSQFPYTTVQIYDPKTDIWTIEDDAPFLRACFTASVVNNRIYAIGGTDRPHPCPAMSTVFEFGPILDFNCDEITDADDICIMVDNWHTDESLCDVAPAPFGDGIVDVQDLIVLAEHLFEEVFPYELVAYWKLDEVEGDIAYNSISDNHGILSGNPTWQHSAGKVAGALEFDGIDDYISTDFVLNPADGEFSVFVWIKGGAPGQAIISQTDGEGTGEIWLGADALIGNLMTGLRPPGKRSPTPPMVSDFVITDGLWHNVGIVVTSRGVRYLYVDGIRVAADSKGVELPSSNGSLYFGTGKNLESDSFFSGLIDEVRIYNKALRIEEIAALAQ